MASTSENVFRPLAHFPQDIWGDRFLQSHVDPSQIEANAKEIELLTEQVRFMLVDESLNHKDKLELINDVERLGISYYFEQEIENQLESIFKTYDHENDYDLYTIGVHFTVFRQHGYKLSSDVFNKFKDSHGKLQASLRSDVKGVLSLYEATQLRMHNEDFMDEAFDLTTDILKSVASNQSNLEDGYLYKQAVHAMKQTWHKGIRRVETGRFIGFYQENESRNETLLRLAKIDFNTSQLVHRQELSQIVRWWKDLDLKTQLPYARDRSLECHYWALAMYYEARYSRARLMMAKVFLVVSILDDTYDAYGTFDELHLLTQAFERWDMSADCAVDELPGKMKIVFGYVFNVYDEFEKEMAREGREFAARYAKARVMDLIRCYYMEVNWAHRRYIPRFDEYMNNARVTSAAQIACSSAMLGMEAEIANEKAFEWFINPLPRVLKSVEAVGRLMDDIVSHQEEQQRGLHVASGVECYMHEHGVSRDEAVIVLRKMIADSWKSMNEELIKPISVSPRVLELPFNLGRVVDSLYKDFDGYTYSAKVMKNEALLVYANAFQV